MVAFPIDSTRSDKYQMLRERQGSIRQTVDQSNSNGRVAVTVAWLVCIISSQFRGDSAATEKPTDFETAEKDNARKKRDELVRSRIWFDSAQ